MAIGCSPYLAVFTDATARAEKANTTITINARRMCTLAWHLLHDGCDFAPNPPKLTLSPVTPLKD